VEIRNWVTFAVAVLVCLALAWFTRRLLGNRRMSQRWPWLAALRRRFVRPGFLTAGLFGAQVGGGPGLLPMPITDPVTRLLGLAMIASTTWLALQVAYAATDVALVRLAEAADRPYRHSRRIRTQIMLLRRVATVMAVIIALGVMLFTFPRVRALGAGLLASAGVIGVIAGVAAQSTLGNLFAGLQLAFNSALRVDDVVVAEGEWGTVEELTLTYVVIRIWDERRLILPVSYFTENPFENWTRYGGEVLGTVLLRVDWSVPTERLRSELHERLSDERLWDGRVAELQVTDVLTNGIVEVRAVVSAGNASDLWDLRCAVREHFVSYIRENHPDALPQLRTVLPEQKPADQKETSARKPVRRAG
jgi:small-conductance mechanosensitive channel